MKNHDSPHSVLPDMGHLLVNERASKGLPSCVRLSWAPGAHLRSGSSIPSTLICRRARSGGGSGTKSTLGKKSLLLPGGWADALTLPGQHHETFHPGAVAHRCNFQPPHVQNPVACEGKAAVLHCQVTGPLFCLNPPVLEERFLRYRPRERSSHEVNRECQSQGQWQREGLGESKSQPGLY